MCLVLLSYKTTPGYCLVLAANRDEFYARQTAPLQPWGAEGRIFSGRDLQAGGTWLGVSTSGRFGAITNYREAPGTDSAKRSRGEILVRYLQSETDGAGFVESLRNEGDCYRGFNLLLGDRRSLYYYSNRAGAPQRLGAGVYALSNHLLDTPWPKVERGRYLFQRRLLGEPFAAASFFAMLADNRQPTADELPETGIGLEWEKILAPIFIRSNGYGTRSSAVLTIDDSGLCRFCERTYSADTAEGSSDVEYTFSTAGSGRHNQDIDDTTNSEDSPGRSSARE